LGDLNIFISFGAGVLFFISPCCLPLYPAFLSYITGLSVTELKEDNNKLNSRPILFTISFMNTLMDKKITFKNRPSVR
jgi:cytochrome c-type biogenesis protein